MIGFAECEPHEYDENCRVCRDAHNSRYDGPRYAADERRLVLRAMGVRSLVAQNQLLAGDMAPPGALHGDDLIDLAVQCLRSLPPSSLETQLDATIPVHRTRNAPITESVRELRAVERRDPRNALSKGTLENLREFYRAEGRLPVIVPIALGAEVAAEVGLPTRFLMPQNMRAELAERFEHELTEIF